MGSSSYAALVLSLACSGCAAVLGIEELQDRPQAPPATSPDAGNETVLQESWLDAAPSSGWYGPLRDRGKPSRRGWCVDFAATPGDATFEYDLVLSGQRIITRLDFHYVLDDSAAHLATAGASGVIAGLFLLGRSRSWDVSTSAIAEQSMARLVIDSGGADGDVAPFDRRLLALPLRIELEATSDTLRGRLYALEDGSYVLKQAKDLTPASEIYDLSRGARPRLGVSSFFGAQNVCMTQVEIIAEP